MENYHFEFITVEPVSVRQDQIRSPDASNRKQITSTYSVPNCLGDPNKRITHRRQGDRKDIYIAAFTRNQSR